MPSTTSPPFLPQTQQLHSRPTTSAASSTRRNNDNRRDPLPFSITRPFRSNPTSTSVAPSTAEGRAIPVDDTTAEHRTSALRELNSHYPSRHRYAKSTGAQSSTYSEPVIVRSYYSPTPNRHDKSTRRRSGRGGAGSEASGPVIGAARSLPFANKLSSTGNGMLSTMARAYNGKISSGEAQQDAHLPPMEAFSFKSFLANMETQAVGEDINSDLDRIAEICARSRYSLSNQYEVHYAPHGSGASFLTSTQSQEPQGPTLQAVPSDDEQDMRTATRRRRQVGRRNSRAMGTLETIMSSSRSSDEEKSLKKSASALADEIRGRPARKTSSDSSPIASTWSERDGSNSQNREQQSRIPARRPSTSLALIDGSRQGGMPADSTPRTSATALVSDPALPQASSSQLETRTALENVATKPKASEGKTFSAARTDKSAGNIARGALSPIQEGIPSVSIISTLTSWLPWMSSSAPAKSNGRAEGSLRDLLKNTEFKGTSAERLP
ncbi:hypothetical protein QQS21_008446 [Conoideocrella luteorostrata]|uniref:Uncharacterized protein n=1 Tax=Conoideocrella luteorostrata TaxID=1105319 RepID=A0AAJ0CLL1_9HYPO|nr:hypothetical protein QQS21_008446 [Conoideocrella luteorostrata]